MNKVLITGANSSLGKHLVSKFKNKGYEIFKHNGSKHYDLTKQNDVQQLAQEAKDFGVNILINNASNIFMSGWYRT